MRLRVTLPAAVLAAALVTGCGAGGGTPVPSPTTAPATTATTGATSPVDADGEIDGPPAAFLQGDGLGDPGAAGAEGSFTWDGSGSDAPWIVSPQTDARGAGPWRVALDPPLAVAGWTTRWAPVRDGVAGDPAAGTTGAGSSIVVQAPGTPGTWSLQLDARFGPGRQATWYWTIDVLP